MRASEWLDPDYGYPGGEVWVAVEHIQSGKITVQKGHKSNGKWYLNAGGSVSECGLTVIACYPCENPPTYTKGECSLCYGAGVLKEYDYEWPCPQCGSNED